jgi:hypothetical protein
MNWKLLGFICEIAVVVAAVAYGLRSHVTIRTLKGRLANLNGTLATIKKNAEFDAEKNIAVWDEMRKLRHEIDVSRQGVNRRDKIIQERDRIIADMDEQARELAEDTARMRDVLGRMEVLGQNLPERKAGDSDAKYLQRCRMAVITKAYEYVQVVDGMALLTVIAPKEDEDVITGATAMDDNCGKRVGGYKGTRIEGPKTAGLNLLEEELSAMKADPRTARELIDLTGDTW